MTAESLHLEAVEADLDDGACIDPLQLAYDSVRSSIADTGSADMSILFQEADVLARRYCLSRLKNVEQADDATQETLVGFLKALERQSDWGGEPIAKLLYGIAKHKVTDQQRPRSAKVTVDSYETVPEIVDGLSHMSPEVSALDRESALTVEALLLKLPAGERSAVSLGLIYGMSANEVADATGSTSGAVRVAKLRGLRKLKLLLTEADEVAPEAGEPLPELQDNISRTINVFSRELGVGWHSIMKKLNELVAKDPRLSRLAERIDTPEILLRPLEQAIITESLTKSGWLPDIAPEDYISTRTLAAEAGVRWETVANTVKDMGDELGEVGQFRFGPARCPGLSPEQKLLVLARLASERQVAPAPDDVRSAHGLAKHLGVHRKMVIESIAALDIELGPTQPYLFGQNAFTGYSPEQQEMIERHLDGRGLLVPEAPPDVMSAYKLSRALQVSQSRLAKAVDALGDDLGVVGIYRFQARRVRGYTPAQQEMLGRYLEVL